MKEKRISPLSDFLISHIAAGEVVERPVSVVKELVENSLDAKATKIYIYLEDGGKKKIVVTDNGTGIHSDDVVLSLEKHTTSKIDTLDDLLKGVSLGFRGEALSSIGAVSHLTMETSDGRERGLGVRVSMIGGTSSTPMSIAKPKGTTLMVENLFYNVPARLKFLKSGRTELSSIIDYLSHVALVRPDVSFSLEQSGKTYLQTNGRGNLLQNLSVVYGHELAKEMYEIKSENHNLKATGFISSVNGARKTRKHQTISINGRIVRNASLYERIEKTSRKYIPPGLHPVVVLNLQVSPEILDCNAHPRKETVRIHEEANLLEMIDEAILNALKSSRHDVVDRSDANVGFNMSSTCTESFKIEIVGQLQNMYILCEVNEKFLIVDQHAAHEAILYHYLRESVLNQRHELPLVELESPLHVELTPSQVSLFDKHKSDLNYFGFEVEPFGVGGMLVRKVPTGIDVRQTQSILSEILSEGMDDYNDWLKNALISASCKSAIKAYDPLSEDMMHFIVKEIILNQITNCPHGRPIYTTTPISDLHKRFKRIL